MNLKPIFDFLAQLQVYNNRKWFNSHKDLYNEARIEFENFINTLIIPVAQLHPSIGTISAEGNDIKDIYTHLHDEDIVREMVEKWGK